MKLGPTSTVCVSVCVCVSGVLTFKFMSSKVYEQGGGNERDQMGGLTSRWKLILNPWG